MRPIGEIRAAVGFLTRVPAGRIDPADTSLNRAGAWFPLVGVLVAAVGVAAWWVGTTAVGPAGGAVLSVLATVVVTGALHEDGLADTADGLWGSTDRDRRLQIMRDSRMGAYGVLALGGDMLLRVALLLPFGSVDVVDVARVVVAGHVLGRAAPLVLAATSPAAHDGGLGTRLGRLSGGGTAVAAGTVAVVAAVSAGWWAPLLIAAALLASAGLRRAAVGRIGGVTGDVMGASVALTYLAVGATVVILIREGLL